MSLSIFVNSDTLIELAPLQRTATGAYVNTATVVMTLKDADEAVVVADVSLPYVADSDGKYQGTLQNTLSLTVGAKYFLEVTATVGTDVLFKRVICWAVYKGADA